MICHSLSAFLLKKDVFESCLSFFGLLPSSQINSEVYSFTITEGEGNIKTMCIPFIFDLLLLLFTIVFLYSFLFLFVIDVVWPILEIISVLELYFIFLYFFLLCLFFPGFCSTILTSVLMWPRFGLGQHGIDLDAEARQSFFWVLKTIISFEENSFV